jgi:ribosomal protein S18 acetylase RimI-like enzyme
MPVVLRALGADDALAYRSLRLRALTEHPEAFLASAEEEGLLSLAAWQDRLQATAAKCSLGAFQDEELLAMGTLVRGGRAKIAHVADIFAVYVAPSARREGLGRRLVSALVEQARLWHGVRKIKLTVNAENAQALRLYEALGFVAYGREPEAMSVNGRLYDELLLQLSV